MQSQEGRRRTRSRASRAQAAGHALLLHSRRLGDRLYLYSLTRFAVVLAIAAGALLIGTASTLTRFGYGQFLYIGELVSAVLMFAGFLMAARPQPAPKAAPAAVAGD